VLHAARAGVKSRIAHRLPNAGIDEMLSCAMHDIKAARGASALKKRAPGLSRGNDPMAWMLRRVEFHRSMR
jgi:hypothetical protein